MKKIVLSLWIGGIFLLISMVPASSQEKVDHKLQIPKENYLIGEEQRLEIIVHVWGEVRQPGEKRVPDGTNILEVISKAGGPTEFSNLSKVLLFSNRGYYSAGAQREFYKNVTDKFILNDAAKLQKTGKAQIDINEYLKNGKAEYLPRLLPGDVIQVNRNVWHKWQTFIRVASQIAIIAQVWYWYNRTQ